MKNESKKVRYTASPKKTVRLSIDCTTEERKMIKMLAAMEDKSMGEFMLSLAKERFQRCPIGHSHIPNDETIAAIRESERGDGVINFMAAEEMFKYLHSINEEGTEEIK